MGATPALWFAHGQIRRPSLGRCRRRYRLAGHQEAPFGAHFPGSAPAAARWSPVGRVDDEPGQDQSI